MKSGGALSGVTVIDLSRLYPGPYCSMILADHGARVIAVEDERFAHDFFFDTVYRNKEHMTLNLKTDKGKEIFFELIKKADVLLEGFRPGVMEKLGVGYPALATINPGLVYCSLTGYGQTGEHNGKAGHDVNFLSVSGILDLVGRPGETPVIPAAQIADVSGGMNAAIGVLLALFERQKSGKGQYIDVSITDSMVGFLPLALFFRTAGGASPQRGNFLLSHRHAFYNVYETKDGKYISLGALEPKFWKNLCLGLKLPEYIPHQYNEELREEIIERVRELFKQKTMGEWEEELAEVDACWSKVQTLDEVVDDPFFRLREMILERETKEKSGEKEPTIGVSLKLERTPGSVRSPAPAFGENTEDILKELGFADKEIEELKLEKII